MATRIAINGFGRIGRAVARILFAQDGGDIELVAINDLTDASMLAHLLQYDSVHRTFSKKVSSGEGVLSIGDATVRVTAERDPAKLDWGGQAIDVVLECTGRFRTRDTAGLHLEAGAKSVIISAPSKDADVTIVMGVNESDFTPGSHSIISNASCTTNCLAPPAKVLLDNFGIERGMLTTVHAYTNDQALLDVPHSKGNLRRSRAGASNMVPTTTGAAEAIYGIIPELEGKFQGMAVRVPTIDVSLIDLTIETSKATTAEEVNAAMRQAATEGPMAKVLDYTEEELVSSDYIGCPASSVIEGKITRVLGDNLVKVVAWYDNEWGFSSRMVDLTRLVASS
jgi:glyceraldehyde 3-phosphate dehydrogenase